MQFRSEEHWIRLPQNAEQVRKEASLETQSQGTGILAYFLESSTLYATFRTLKERQTKNKIRRKIAYYI